jgi:hypothetical protein
MSQWNTHFRDLHNRLGVLRELFDAEESSEHLKFFDEYLSVNEFELALHALCNFLLESTTPAVDEIALKEIQALHIQMELEDDCTRQLTAKLFPAS